MKLRIKGNSVRIRLSKTEVDELVSGLSIEETTSFGENTFGYTVKPVNYSDQLTASYDNNIISLYVPKVLLKDWSTNSVVGFEAMMPLDDSDHLHLLLEKDFKCLDKTIGDQSDFFDNPSTNC
ncbi:MAG: hypothetical protein JNK79_07780 [Chitinophagaceae bacterium]|nr:hypothetical protein [Chitinophagaceae bacterium]